MPFSKRFTKLNFLITPLFVGMLVSIPLWVGGIPVGPDLSHHTRVAGGFYTAFETGDFYPSWISTTNDDYGDPTSRFYPPLLYLILSFFRFLTPDWFFAFLLTFTFINIIGAIGMFLWVNELTANKYYSAGSAFIFPLMAFHTNGLYQSALFGNYASACFIPFVFYFIGKLINENDWRSVGGLSISLAVVVYTHVPMAVFCSICAVIYTIFLWWRNKNIATLGKIFLGVGLATIISSAYWVTMLSELKWKAPSGIGQGEWFDYRNNFLLQPSLTPMFDWWLTMLLIATGLFFLPTIILIFKKDKSSTTFFVLTFFTFFMTTPSSRFIWDMVQFLQETQFPSRWMTMTSMFLSVLAALSVSHFVEIWKSRFRSLAIIVFGIWAISLSFSVFQIIRTAIFQNRTAFNQTATDTASTETNKDFLPIWTKGTLKKMSVAVESERKINVLQWNQSSKIFDVDEGKESSIRLKLLFYPHWRAYTENNELLDTFPAEDGALMVAVPSKFARVFIHFIEPTKVQISNILSIIGALASVLLILKKPKAITN